MKALSIRQPWASQILDGTKTTEYRSWYTHHRGPLLICAAARPHAGLPVGVALCVVDVVACLPLKAGGYGWLLRDVQPVEPFPVKGRLGLFEVDY